MPVVIKSEREIELMTHAGKILAEVHEKLKEEISSGITTYQIDQIGEELIRAQGCIPSFLNYNGYPASVCVSINEEVVHGIPSKERILTEGDIVSLDIGVLYKGYHSDAARTYGVGKISKDAEDLIRVTKESFYEGIKYATKEYRLFDISKAIGEYAQSRGYGVVEALCGHGVGKDLHEEPQIPNYDMGRRGMRLRPGMTLAIEPMINLGTKDVKWLDDKWTVVTMDGKISAHYEHTILITENEPQILTPEKREANI